MSRLRSHLTYANVMSSIAVFAVLGGAAVAAVTIPNNSVGTKQLKKNAVVSKKVTNGSLLKKDFKAGQLPAGERGPTGPKGDPGTNGTNGTNGTDGQDGAPGAPGPATGPAGGGLAGNYPNPTIATGAVGPSQWGTIPQAKATVGNPQSIPIGETGTVVNFDGPELFDTAALHGDATNSRLTVPIAGVYAVTASLSWAADGTGTRQLQIRKNGVGGQIVHSQIISSNGSAEFFTIQTTATLVKLAAGDYLEVRGQQGTVGALNVVNGDFGMTWAGAG